MRKSLRRIDHWWHELGNCLHSTMAITLRYNGLDPAEVLGAGWAFQYRQGDVRREEYYQPCPPGVSLAESLAPHHGVRSRWHQPSDAGEAWSQVRARIRGGQPAIVAVDNFHLPFRPAYGDVHTNHLVVVAGFDDDAGTVEVIDSVPPRFHGWLPMEVLDRSRGSVNPLHHDRDMFFTDNPIAYRWLDVYLHESPRHLTPASLHLALSRNLAGFRRKREDDWHFGLAGLRQLFEDFAGRHGSGVDCTDELFVVAGSALAGTALHADYLAAVAGRFGVPALAEAGRWVSRVAHHWTALRILAARARGRPEEAEAVSRRGRRLLGDLAQALDAIDVALPDLYPAESAASDAQWEREGEVAWSALR